MATIHLVYAVPPVPRSGKWRNRALAAYEMASDRMGIIPKYYRNGWLPGLPQPLNAPWSITYHLHDFLKQHMDVKLYDWQEKGKIDLNPRDIILGHPHPDPDTIVQRTFRAGRPCRLKALIFPIHHKIESINEYAVPLIDKADIVFGIMGRYWFDTLGDSFLAEWKDKIVRLDMAVDSEEYPSVKKDFNKAGSRGYLYIGLNKPEKGSEVLSETMQQLTDYRRGWIGPGEDIEFVDRIAEFARLEPSYVEKLAREYDIFVNTSISDANPTTILEAMAWGFPVACTPQSGYYDMPSITGLSTTDIKHNIKKLLELQFAPEEHLLQLSRENRRLVESTYTWKKFCSTVWQVIGPLI